MFQQKRRPIDSKKNFGKTADFGQTTYPHRLNFYNLPPTAEVTLEQFEQWAIDRLRILGEIESCLYRNKTPAELSATITPLLDQYLPLSANTAKARGEEEERRKDHYSHFILRLAFARSEELRNRFTRAETVLFKLRFTTDDPRERSAFVSSLGFDWETVGDDEKRALRESLIAATGMKSIDGESFFKVDWEKVSDLVEQRRVLLRAGKAYVPVSQQISLVLAEFTQGLENALKRTAQALPRLDEDDRLIPILNHLSLGFTTSEYTNSNTTTLNGATITAGSIDGLVQYMPLCMRHLHTTLRRDKHLKHFGRYQYNLFLKGIGLSVEESLIFWRQSFSLMTDDQFTKEYRYNIRHAYGLQGTGRNYKPLSCQQILTERAPTAGQAHGCPYRHFSVDNLIASLNAAGIHDRDLLKGVKTDVEATKFHIACNRVFEHAHARELKKESETGSARFKETIIHPNEYFTRSFMLRNPDSAAVEGMGNHQAVDTGVDPML
ncbi:uncharacterized protein LAJ45_03401 [Morchella importuna]|uniref:DNA primase large subunit n=1 Tax=Morchella conica CCBAS932 TaxID=1392247 RepID=A0A3N4KKN3_9PEZI|nr:uncharacterized protein LAJ45_03401 [Morchella importuna]KAH8152560.1 hypothetical protein LAJ45_03401 [Morchella importuna]RPB11123.1 DNA primase, large subunit [Morchella conica CCBAS932]